MQKIFKVNLLNILIPTSIIEKYFTINGKLFHHIIIFISKIIFLLIYNSSILMRNTRIDLAT